MKHKFILGALCLFLSGCGERNISMPGESKDSADGIHYKIVTIEGRKFIATQTYQGYYTLAGPIDK